MKKENPFEYIKNHYQVPAEFGRDVIVGERKGTITEDMGNYIGVTFHNDKRLRPRPCHPTSEVIYLDTFTTIKKLQPKNQRSKQRYLDYLHADGVGTFAEFLGIKKHHPRY